MYSYSGSDIAREICLATLATDSEAVSRGDGGAPVGSCLLNYKIFG